tara:strand:+ start:2487 stop:4985 length:2499 start_codon:yes stop_codon:yes gene_type:complete
MLVMCLFALGVGSTHRQLCAQDSTLDAAIPMIRQSGDQRALIGALSGAAMQHMQAGRGQLAADRVDEAIALCRETNDASMLSTPLMVATQILGTLDGNAPKEFLTSLLSESSGNAKIESQIMKQLGQHLLQSGDLVLAIQVFHDFVDTLESDAGGDTELAWAKWQFGQACMLGKMYDLGVPALKQARTLAIKAGDKTLASQCDGAIGNACLRSREFETAVEFFSNQHEIARQLNETPAIDAANVGLVNAMIGLKEYDKAEQKINSVVAEGNGMQRGMMQGYAAMIAAAKGDISTAITLSRQAIDSKLSMLPVFVRNQVGPQTVMTDELSLAHLALLDGDFDEATAAAGRADAAYQSMLKQFETLAAQGAVSLDSSRTALSPIAADISNIRQIVDARRGDHAASLLEAERGRGQAQAEAMKRNFGAENDNTAKTELTLDDLREIASNEKVTFVEYSVVHAMDAVSRATLGPTVDIANQSEIYVWVLDPSGRLSFRATQLDQPVTDLVDAVRNSILEKPEDAKSSDEADEADKPAESSNAPAKEASNPLRHMAEILIDPIEAFLPTDVDAEVVIIPHGELYAVPFAALVDANDKPLIEKHVLSSSGSIELYGLSAKRRGAAKALKYQDILVVGNPKMPAYRFRPDKPASPLDPLPGAEAEAEAIAKLLGIQPLIGDAASEATVQQAMHDAPVIHLATHGLLESDNVFSQSYLSAIALSPDENENGFLTVREIMEMKLNADLAVLSACDTGRGKITGEGVVGLSRAYLSAGVPTVIVSLWPVSDRATAVLMVNFYDGMKKGLSKAAALRQATLINRQRFTEPRLWAPFTLYGVGH